MTVVHTARKTFKTGCFSTESMIITCTQKPLSGWAWCKEHLPPAFQCTNEKLPVVTRMYPLPQDVIHVAGYFEDRWCRPGYVECSMEHFVSQARTYISLPLRVHGWVVLRFVDVDMKQAVEIIQDIMNHSSAVVHSIQNMHVDYLLDSQEHEQIATYDLKGNEPSNVPSCGRRVKHFARFLKDMLARSLLRLVLGYFPSKRRHHS